MGIGFGTSLIAHCTTLYNQGLFSPAFWQLYIFIVQFTEMTAEEREKCKCCFNILHEHQATHLRPAEVRQTAEQTGTISHWARACLGFLGYTGMMGVHFRFQGRFSVLTLFGNAYFVLLAVLTSELQITSALQQLQTRAFCSVFLELEGLPL